jgi:hypothetical protein
MMSNRDYLAEIRAATDFVIPPEFVKLEEADLLRFGENYEHWRGNWKRICMTRPPALVCAPWYTSVEWYTPEEMTRWSPPDYWIPRPIIAFARSGSGDEWCWFPELTDDLGTRVVFCAHDENDAEIYATNFQAFLYRILLESFAYIGSKGIVDFDGESGYKRYLELNVAVLEFVLKPEWVETLGALLAKDFVAREDNDQVLCLLDQRELEELHEQHILLRDVGQHFEHMQ